MGENGWFIQGDLIRGWAYLWGLLIFILNNRGRLYLSTNHYFPKQCRFISGAGKGNNSIYFFQYKVGVHSREGEISKFFNFSN